MVGRIVFTFKHQPNIVYMKGERGICQVGLGSSSIRRTKYDTEINCMDALKSLKALGVISQNSVIYKCNSCLMWHIEKR